MPAACRVPGSITVMLGMGEKCCPLGSSWVTQLLGENIGRIQERKKSLDSCRYRRDEKQWALGGCDAGE